MTLLPFPTMIFCSNISEAGVYYVPGTILDWYTSEQNRHLESVSTFNRQDFPSLTCTSCDCSLSFCPTLTFPEIAFLFAISSSSFSVISRLLKLHLSLNSFAVGSVLSEFSIFFPASDDLFSVFAGSFLCPAFRCS